MSLSPFSLEFEPFGAMLRLQEELQRAFEAPLWTRTSGRGVFPPMNVFSERDGYVVRMEVPGLGPENLNIEGHGSTLTVSGKRETSELPDAGAHRRERWAGEFSRSLQLPADLDPTRATASYRHGVLTIRVPRREEAKPRQIAVTAS